MTKDGTDSTTRNNEGSLRKPAPLATSRVEQRERPAAYGYEAAIQVPKSRETLKSSEIGIVTPIPAPKGIISCGL